MTGERLDLTDPAVRWMAESNHTPDETWTMDGRLLYVGCSACHQTWPCPTVVDLRAMAAEEGL